MKNKNEQKKKETMQTKCVTYTCDFFKYAQRTSVYIKRIYKDIDMVLITKVNLEDFRIYNRLRGY